MGGGRWTSDDWKSYSVPHVYSKATTADIYKSSLGKTLDPMNVKIRESRDSVEHPKSVPIIVALDVTGSMSPILDDMAKNGLPTLMEEIYKRKPVTDPQVMFMGVGDVSAGDRAPLQVSQFESDIRIAEQLTELYLEHGGGGNNSESYILPWYFAAMHTSIDSWEKRQKKGYLFTIGDEEITPHLSASEINRVLGYSPETNYTPEQLFELVSKKYEVYHLMVTQGNHFICHGDAVKKSWVRRIGERAIPLTDHSKLGEVIISLIEFNEGKSKDEIVDSWNGSTSMTVKEAIKDLKVKETDGIIVL